MAVSVTGHTPEGNIVDRDVDDQDFGRLFQEASCLDTATKKQANLTPCS